MNIQFKHIIEKKEKGVLISIYSTEYSILKPEYYTIIFVQNKNKFQTKCSNPFIIEYLLELNLIKIINTNTNKKMLLTTYQIELTKSALLEVL